MTTERTAVSRRYALARAETRLRSLLARYAPQSTEPLLDAIAEYVVVLLRYAGHQPPVGTGGVVIAQIRPTQADRLAVAGQPIGDGTAERVHLNPDEGQDD